MLSLQTTHAQEKGHVSTTVCSEFFSSALQCVSITASDFCTNLRPRSAYSESLSILESSDFINQICVFIVCFSYATLSRKFGINLILR